MGERTDVEDRLRGADMFRESRLRFATVDMPHLKPLAGELSRVQDDEARAIGDEVCIWRGGRGEEERAVARSFDLRLVDEPLFRIRTNGAIADGEALGALLDFNAVNLGPVRSPILVANQKGDSANSLDPAESDIAELAVLQFRRQSPSDEPPTGRIRRIGPAELDRARGLKNCHRRRLTKPFP